MTTNSKVEKNTRDSFLVNSSFWVYISKTLLANWRMKKDIKAVQQMGHFVQMLLETYSEFIEEFSEVENSIL